MTESRLARAERPARAFLLPFIAIATLPMAASALEARFDHRDEKGPAVEALFARDVVWRGSTLSTTSSRGAVRVAWGFDPTGEGNELFFGATFTAVEGASSSPDRVRLALDTRYRVMVGTEEFKTLLEVGLWGTAAERFSVGPLVGLGFIYDFNRNIGVFSSAYLAAAVGQSRTVSYGGGLGIQFRYE